MKIIEGFNGRYTIHENGTIFDRLKGKFLKEHKFGKGYRAYRLRSESKSIIKTTHRALAENFIENKENKPIVNHKNGIKHDNRLINLEWATYSENNKHAFDNGFNYAILGSKRHTSTILEETVFLIREMFKDKKPSIIARELNLGYDLVRNICIRKTWKHI